MKDEGLVDKVVEQVGKLTKRKLNRILKKHRCRVGIIFVGGCGCNDARRFIKKFSPDEFPDLHLFVADTNSSVLLLHFPSDDERVMLWKKGGRLIIHPLGDEGRGAGTDPQKGREAAESEKSIAALTKFIMPRNKILLVAGVGKGTGSGASPVIAKLAVKLLAKQGRRNSLTAVITVPRENEGRGTQPQEALKKIKDLANTFTIYNDYLDEFLQNEYPEDFKRENLTYQQSHELVSMHSTQRIITILREWYQVTGDESDFDEADHEKLNSFGHDCFMGLAKIAPDPMPADLSEEAKANWVPTWDHIEPFKVAQDLVRCNFQDDGILQRGLAFAMWCHGPVPKFKAEAIQDHVRSHMTRAEAKGKKNATVRYITSMLGIVHNTTDKEMWIAIVAVADHNHDATEKVVFAKQLEGTPLTVGSGKTVSAENSITEIRFKSRGEDIDSMWVKKSLAERFNKIMDPDDTTPPEEIVQILDEVEDAIWKSKRKRIRPDPPERLKSAGLAIELPPEDKSGTAPNGLRSRFSLLQRAER